VKENGVCGFLPKTATSVLPRFLETHTAGRGIAGTAAIGWGEAADEPSSQSSGAPCPAREHARPTEIFGFYQCPIGTNFEIHNHTPHDVEICHVVTSVFFGGCNNLINLAAANVSSRQIIRFCSGCLRYSPPRSGAGIRK
jgi:hypothetical protein